MYIVFETDDNISQLMSKYLLLELDTFENDSGATIKTYCVIDNEHIAIGDIEKLQPSIHLHEALIRNYHIANWSFCEEALKHLPGTFKGELDSFYELLDERIQQLKDIHLPETWNGNIRAQTAENK